MDIGAVVCSAVQPQTGQEPRLAALRAQMQGRALGSDPLPTSDRQVLCAAEELGHGVEVTGVGGGLDEDVDQGRAQVREGLPGLGPPLLVPDRRGIEGESGDDRV